MLKFAPLVCTAALMLSACANDGTYSSGYYGGGVAYNSAFYDDFYGPYYDGYWGPGDVFIFTEAPGRPFRRDDARHFRHEAAQGFHRINPRVAMASPPTAVPTPPPPPNSAPPMPGAPDSAAPPRAERRPNG